ncbi:hypothetical protein [Natronosalvus vescus]|uniref:hypothetical protein n=1 Tax=Natronosalvus vescus TaxID=2953881 RepID=UPI002090C7CE|nr:hypothetical protein [Natronosalvus vescus]
MGRVRLTRRQYSVAITSGLVAALAGCLDGDDADDDLEPADDDDAVDDDQEDETDGTDSDDEQDADDQDSDDDAAADENDYGAVGELTVILENEDGDPVSDGVEVQVMHDEEGVGVVTEEIIDGVAQVELVESGPYTVRAESLTDEFESVEEGIEVEGDEEITLVLEGAAGDEDVDEDDGEEEDDGE